MNDARRFRRAALLLGLAVIAQTSVAAAQADEPGYRADPATGEPGEAPAQETGVEGDAYADTDPSALTDFQATLEPHGAWADDPTYGTVWTPNPSEVGSDFTPYASAGHWAYDDDYVWVSDYEWGWATFHYGRWAWLAGRGWGWVPGRLYASSWVSWRVGDDTAFLGWAPVAPTWGWRGGVATSLGIAPREPYVFVPSHNVFAPALMPYLAPNAQASVLVGQTRPYVAATPVVGRPAASAAPRGPSPLVLGIAPSHVTRITRSDPALDRARRFARPSTALALGARPAAPHAVRASPNQRPPSFARPAAPREPERRK